MSSAVTIDIDELSAGPIDDELAKKLVCVLPQGFELTEAKYSKILEAWNLGGCVMLGEDEVSALFTIDRLHR